MAHQYRTNSDNELSIAVEGDNNEEPPKQLAAPARAAHARGPEQAATTAEEKHLHLWWQYRPPAGNIQAKDILQFPGAAPKVNCSQIYPFYTFQAFSGEGEDSKFLRLADGEGWVEASHCERHQSDPHVSVQQVAYDLAGRGFTVRQLLSFWRTHAANPGTYETFTPSPPAVGNWLGQIDKTTTTNDLVRDIVIPQTAERMTSYMESDFMLRHGGPTRPTVLISHWWGNRFYYDIVCILEHATGCSGYLLELLIGHANFNDSYHSNLESGRFYGHNLPMGFLDQAYWMCIFAVNQHASICGTRWNPCKCTAAKLSTGHPSCQMDKFDLVMGVMSRGLVVALDPHLITLMRCWCVSEIGKCLEMNLNIRYFLPAKLEVKSLRVQSVVDCQATLPADRLRILQQITDTVGVAEFDKQVRDSVIPTLVKIALLQAAQEGHTAEVQELLDRSANVNSRNGAGQCSLWLAAERGNLQVVETVLARGADKDLADNRGVTPLRHASFCGHFRIVEALLKAGAAKNRADWLSSTPVYVAALKGHARVVDMLLAAQADKDQVSSFPSKHSPLTIAAHMGHQEVCRILLSYGANMAYKALPKPDEPFQSQGGSAADIAKQQGHTEVLKLFRGDELLTA